MFYFVVVVSWQPNEKSDYTQPFCTMKDKAQGCVKILLSCPSFVLSPQAMACPRESP